MAETTHLNTLNQKPGLRMEAVSFAVDGATIVEKASLRIEPPSLVGVVGPNGAGKTTLLRLLTGLIKPTSGDLYLSGHPLSHFSHRTLAQRIAMVPQGTLLEFPFTSLEIVLMGRSPHLTRFGWPSATDRRIALESMRRTGTQGFAERAVTTLSGGERQRVLLARALATQSPFIILDEPTASLDIEHTLAFMDLAQNLSRQGAAVVMALHDLAMAYRYCDRVVLMYRGRLMADGRPAEVLTPQNIRRAFGVEAVPVCTGENSAESFVFRLPKDSDPADAGLPGD